MLCFADKLLDWEKDKKVRQQRGLMRMVEQSDIGDKEKRRGVIRKITGPKRMALQLLCLALLAAASLCQGCGTVYEEERFCETLQNAEVPGGGETIVQSVAGLYVETDVETDVDADEILSEIPRFSGEAYVTLNQNIPGFTSEEKESREAFESYSDLDELGRCGTAYANICPETMPTEERGEIGQIRPSGWQLVKYDIVEGKYLYNRCHLIAYQLAGENANEKNLITGTRYFNVSGMLPYENKVADYVRETGNHVLYRVTPVYQGEDLVAAGVQMEAYSLEDDGAGVCYNVFVYNCQPGISIDYATGESRLTEENGKEAPVSAFGSSGINRDDKGELPDTEAVKEGAEEPSKENPQMQEYVLNTNTKRFHLPDCASVGEMKPKNKKETVCSREDLIRDGYIPCKRCNP